MSLFWYSQETIPDGVGFTHYSPVHLFWLALFVVAAIVCSLHYRKLSTSGRALWRKMIAILVVADELFKQFGLILGGNWDPGYLPLHLCSINIFVIAYHCFTLNPLAGNFLYTACIPGAIAALLFPTCEELPLLNFMHIHFFTVHILLALYPIVLTAGADITPDAKQIPGIVAVLAVLAAIMYFINPLLDANFFFMASASKGNPLYWFKQNWGNHLYGFPVLVCAILLAMHGPVVWYRKLKQRKQKA